MYIKYLRPRNTDERSPVVCTGSDGQGSSLHLVAHLADRFRGRPHKPHPRVVARLRKVGALREKAVAWVDGIHAVFLKAKPEQKVNPCFHGARCSTQAEHHTQRQSEQSSKKTMRTGQVRAAAAILDRAGQLWITKYHLLSNTRQTSCHGSFSWQARRDRDARGLWLLGDEWRQAWWQAAGR